MYDVDSLIRFGARLLVALGYGDYSILVRNGDASGKTVRHLHHHVIPNMCIGPVDSVGQDRSVMTHEEIGLLMAEFDQVISTV